MNYQPEHVLQMFMENHLKCAVENLEITGLLINLNGPKFLIKVTLVGQDFVGLVGGLVAISSWKYQDLFNKMDLE